MRRRRTIYFNDARHCYLFIYDPPFRLEDAWVPIDEVAGTSVDTFIYGVARGDGLFYPSKVGLRFGEGLDGFDLAAYWRVWHNMQSLIDRGLDPLKVLIDRAHEKGMDFFSSLRMGEQPGMPSGVLSADRGEGVRAPGGARPPVRRAGGAHHAVSGRGRGDGLCRELRAGIPSASDPRKHRNTHQ